jgi:hypothetical protein
MPFQFALVSAVKLTPGRTLACMQVLTNEEWYEIMWNLMDSEFRYACAYFMSIIVIGETRLIA